MQRPLFLFLVVSFLGAAMAQQAQPPAAAAAESLTAEQRLERLEALVARRSLQDSPTLGDASLEQRLIQLESRVQRLEQQALRSGSAGGADRYLESRVRALEREVARLRR